MSSDKRPVPDLRTVGDKVTYISDAYNL